MTALAAERVACLLAGQPGGFGGVHLRAPADRAREAWLDHLRGLLPGGTPWLRVPPAAPVDALVGGLDLAATLAAGRPVVRPGLLARAHGGILILSLAARPRPLVAACLQQALDQGFVQLEREGLREHFPARFSLLVLDQALDGDGAGELPEGLVDRLSFSLESSALAQWLARREVKGTPARPDDSASAAAVTRLPHRILPTAAAGAPVPPSEPSAPDPLAALCAGALQLGIASLRAPLQALAVARVLALGQGRALPDWQDAVEAAGLVYAGRATRMPAPPPEQPAQASEPPPQDISAPDNGPPPDRDPSASTADPAQPPSALPDASQERFVAAVAAQLPPDVLARLALPAGQRGSGRATAHHMKRQRAAGHGRPCGSRPGDPRQGPPLDLLATVRAALPWQKLRQHLPDGGARLAIRGQDLQVRRLRPRLRSTAVFAVDASGSAALHRLNEAKGAVASLLARCYVRRDQVALVSFRGAGASLCLPPTRSLARVHRELAALPGGGGTPLAGGLAMAGQLAGELRRRGEAPLLVLLTDGRANVGLDGVGGRARAEQQALAEAGRLRQAGIPSLLVDISPQPQPRAAALAQAMGADYLALPAASAQRLAAAVASRMPARQARHA